MPGGAYAVEGGASIWAVREALGAPLPDSTEYATLAGFLLPALGAGPARGASVVFGGFRWSVLEMAGPRIVSVRVDREPPAGTPAPSRKAGPPGSR